MSVAYNGFTVAGVLPSVLEQLIRLHGEIAYNDGTTVSTTYWNPDHDFSNAVFGISTDVPITDQITLTPSAYYQHRLNDTINDDPDDIWA